MHREIIILDDDTDEDESMSEHRFTTEEDGNTLQSEFGGHEDDFLSEAFYTAEEKDGNVWESGFGGHAEDIFLSEHPYTSNEMDGNVSQSGFGGDSSRRGNEDRGGCLACPEPMPLRQIKQRVRSCRNDDDDVCAASSAVPKCSTRQQQHVAEELEVSEKNLYHQPGQQVKQSNSLSSKRARGLGDQDWMPSDLLDVFHSGLTNEVKRVRENGNVEHRNYFPQAIYGLAQDVPMVPSAVAQPTESDVQVQIQNSLIDVHQAILEMPQEAADAFKELARLVVPFKARASRAVDEMKNSHALTNYVEHFPPLRPPPSPSVTITESQQSSRAMDEMESMQSITSDFHEHPHTAVPPPATPDAARTANEMENWNPVAIDFQDYTLLSQRSATSSDFDLDDSPANSSGDFDSDDSPLLDTVDQPTFLLGGASQCSLHPAAIDDHQHPDKRRSPADVVLYEPKQEPVESKMENNTSSFVVHIKEEQGLHHEATPYPVSIRPVEANGGVAPGYSTKELVDTLLRTFEAVRQQIVKDPTYGQPQTPGMVTCKARRPDLKAGSLMRKKGFWLKDKPIGNIPGVEVGDFFRYRMAMAVIGLHRQIQAGIAFVKLKFPGATVSVATSVVLGVGEPYRDDRDMGETVIYSGQGGLCGKTKESQDQELTRGNLALKNSYELKAPVRFIRGHRMQNSTDVGYTYDGLYQVTNWEYVQGVKGKMVYKFTMERLPGQGPICSPYPRPLESQSPVKEPAQNAVHWTEPADVKPLYLH